MSAAPAQKEKSSTTARAAITSGPAAAAIEPRKNKYKKFIKAIESGKPIQTRWLKVINARLTEDKITATKVKRDKKSLHQAKETWEPILKRSANIPHNWVHNCEVLVGRRT
jgi:hypothetical protein